MVDPNVISGLNADVVAGSEDLRNLDVADYNIGLVQDAKTDAVQS